MSRRGFTLIEVISVIGIVAILAAMLFPVFARAREQARKVSCASNLMQVGAALELYSRSYDGRYPTRNNDLTPLYPYTKSAEVFYCPSDSQEHKWGAKRPGHDDSPAGTSSYVYRGGLGSDSRADTAVASEVQVFHGGVANVLYLGGYVKGAAADGYKPIVAPDPTPTGRDDGGGMPGAPLGPGM